MNRLFLKLITLAMAIAYSGCANIEVGFEEDSPFYSKPEATTKSKVSNDSSMIKRDKLSTRNIRKTNTEEENETTFYYEFVEE